MKRTITLVYGVVNYALGSGALVALIAFLFNLIPDNPVLSNIDALETTGFGKALAINIALIILFGLQHSVMARPRFKKWLTAHIPHAAERSTYMMATGVVTFALIVLWQPMHAIVWQAESNIAWNTLLAVGLGGWALVLYATFLINHFDLFGLRQVWLYFTGKEYTQLPFKLTSLYRYIRHPIMTGAFIGIWVTPVMTVGHMVFTLGMSAYILIGVYHEEKDLLRAFGERYRQYRENTGRFLPVFGNSNTGKPVASSD